MLKVAFFKGEDEQGPRVIPLFGPADSVFEKIAAPTLLPDVAKYIAGLRPSNDSQYVLLNAMGASEWWGCFPAGTLVTTERGAIPIEAVTVGTQVLTHKNRLRAVTGKTSKHASQLVDVSVCGLPRLTPVVSPTPNHEFWIVPRADFIKHRHDTCYFNVDRRVPIELRRERMLRTLKFSWCAAASLQKGDMLAEPFPIEELPAVMGSEWSDTDLGFLFGLYAAEGCVSDTHKMRRCGLPQFDKIRNGARERPLTSVVFVMSETELNIAKHVQAITAKYNRSTRIYHNKVTHSLRVEVSWQAFAEACVDNIGRLSTEKQLSQALLRMPRAWQREFFFAYAGGDGCTTKEGRGAGSNTCVSASFRLLYGMRLVLARLGMVASISGRHNTKASWYNGNPIFSMLVGSSQLSGKKPQAKSYIHPDGFILSAVVSKTVRNTDEAVFDLQVAEDHSYTAAGIAVHNSNINGDAFNEESLIHRPDEWTGNPLIDREKSRDWPYGFPTFYFAHPYAHHRNKDATRAFGDVELAVWHPRMKRVELVTRVDKDKCTEFGGTGVWDKLKAGELPDVSMGCKVPFDTCSICLDWDTYRRAQGMFVPGRHKSPGDAVLAYHKELIKKNGKGIRGVSITRKDYCVHASKQMNHILPDGRKVFVWNDFPKFFDISFVFIGADRTAKAMMKIAGEGKSYWFLNGAELAEKLGYTQDDDILLPEFAPSGIEFMKSASVTDETLKHAFLGKLGRNKDAEIIKDVMPSQFANKAVPILTRNEKDIPKEVLDALGASPLEEALSTPTGLGMVLRPREFQRIILIQMGKRPLADELDRDNKVFPKSDERLDVPMGPEFFSQILARLLLPMMSERSGLGPSVEKRVLVATEDHKEKKASTSSLSNNVLRKMGAAYNGYRMGVMELVTHAQELISSMSMTTNEPLSKLASSPVESVFTPLSASYFKLAFLDEVGSNTPAFVERGYPSRNTAVTHKRTSGGY